jgi:uncharacterized membrane protein YphA (DoxX/SURF4 family)
MYLAALPYAEIAVGTLLVLGLLTRVGGFFASLMLLSFIVAVTGVKGAGDAPFQTNVVFLGLALLLFFAGGGKIGLDGMLFGKKKARKGWGASDDE